MFSSVVWVYEPVVQARFSLHLIVLAKMTINSIWHPQLTSTCSRLKYSLLSTKPLEHPIGVRGCTERLTGSGLHALHKQTDRHRLMQRAVKHITYSVRGQHRLIPNRPCFFMQNPLCTPLSGFLSTQDYMRVNLHRMKHRVENKGGREEGWGKSKRDSKKMNSKVTFLM